MMIDRVQTRFEVLVPGRGQGVSGGEGDFARFFAAFLADQGETTLSAQGSGFSLITVDSHGTGAGGSDMADGAGGISKDATPCVESGVPTEILGMTAENQASPFGGSGAVDGDAAEAAGCDPAGTRSPERDDLSAVGGIYGFFLELPLIPLVAPGRLPVQAAEIPVVRIPAEIVGGEGDEPPVLVLSPDPNFPEQFEALRVIFAGSSESLASAPSAVSGFPGASESAVDFHVAETGLTDAAAVGTVAVTSANSDRPPVATPPLKLNSPIGSMIAHQEEGAERIPLPAGAKSAHVLFDAPVNLTVGSMWKVSSQVFTTLGADHIPLSEAAANGSRPGFLEPSFPGVSEHSALNTMRIIAPTELAGSAEPDDLSVRTGGVKGQLNPSQTLGISHVSGSDHRILALRLQGASVGDGQTMNREMSVPMERLLALLGGIEGEVWIRIEISSETTVSGDAREGRIRLVVPESAGSGVPVVRTRSTGGIIPPVVSVADDAESSMPAHATPAPASGSARAGRVGSDGNALSAQTAPAPRSEGTVSQSRVKLRNDMKGAFREAGSNGTVNTDTGFTTGRQISDPVRTPWERMPRIHDVSGGSLVEKTDMIPGLTGESRLSGGYPENEPTPVQNAGSPLSEGVNLSEPFTGYSARQVDSIAPEEAVSRKTAGKGLPGSMTPSNIAADSPGPEAVSRGSATADGEVDSMRTAPGREGKSPLETRMVPSDGAYPVDTSSEGPPERIRAGGEVRIDRSSGQPELRMREDGETVFRFDPKKASVERSSSGMRIGESSASSAPVSQGFEERAPLVIETSPTDSPEAGEVAARSSGRADIRSSESREDAANPESPGEPPAGGAGKTRTVMNDGRAAIDRAAPERVYPPAAPPADALVSEGAGGSEKQPLVPASPESRRSRNAQDDKAHAGGNVREAENRIAPGLQEADTADVKHATRGERICHGEHREEQGRSPVVSSRSDPAYPSVSPERGTVPCPDAAPENEFAFPATGGERIAAAAGGSGDAGLDLAGILSVSRPGGEKSNPVLEAGRGFSHMTGGYQSRDHREFEAGVMNTIVRQARLLLMNRKSSATVVLEPPSLGRLKLDIVTENSKITGNILVESREVQEIIRMNISDLRQSLAQNGLSIESFDVNVGHNGGADVWARREDMESIASLMRTFREEKNGFLQETPNSEEMRRRNIVRSPGSIDVWI